MDAQIVARHLSKLRPPMISLVDIVIGAVLLAVVAIAATLVVVGHPRPWWTHSTFDVDDYISNDLVPRINRNVDLLIALKHAGEKDTGRAVRRMSVSADGALSFAADGDVSSRPATRAAYALLVRSCPALGTLTHDTYDRSDFTSGLADLGDAESVRNSRPRAYNLLIVQAADACGTLTSSVCDTYLGLLLLISREDMVNLQQDHVNVGLADLARPYVSAIGAPGPDPYIAHIGHCASTGGTGLEEHRVVAERAACALLALVDLGYIYNVVVPQVRSMRYSRRAKGFSNVFWLFFNAYSTQWFSKQTELVRQFKDKMSGLNQGYFLHIVNAFISKLKATIY